MPHCSPFNVGSLEEMLWRASALFTGLLGAGRERERGAVPQRDGWQGAEAGGWGRGAEAAVLLSFGHSRAG